MGKSYGHVTIRCEVAPTRDTQSACGKSGSLAIDSCSGAEAQWFKNAGIRAQVCGPTGACPAMERVGWSGKGSAGQVLCRLKQGWSPEQVAGRLAMESQEGHLPSSIYGQISEEGLWVETYLSRSGAGEAAKGAVLPPSWTPGHWEEPIAGAMSQVLGQMPPEWRRTGFSITGMTVVQRSRLSASAPYQVREGWKGTHHLGGRRWPGGIRRRGWGCAGLAL